MRPTLKMLKDCNSVEDVKKLLRKFDIKGNKVKVGSCPIANYVRKATKKSHIEAYCDWGLSYGNKDKKMTKMATPMPVQDFIVGFDNDEYPEFISQ